MRFLKEYVIITMILIIIFSIEFWTSNQLDNSTESIKNGIKNIENKVDEQAFEEAKKEFEKLEENWRGDSEKLAFFVEHNELEKINNNFAKIKANFKTEENNMLMENISELKFIIEHIQEKSKLKLKNIF